MRGRGRIWGKLIDRSPGRGNPGEEQIQRETKKPQRRIRTMVSFLFFPIPENTEWRWREVRNAQYPRNQKCTLLSQETIPRRTLLLTSCVRHTPPPTPPTAQNWCQPLKFNDCVDKGSSQFYIYKSNCAQILRRRCTPGPLYLTQTFIINPVPIFSDKGTTNWEAAVSSI